MHRWWGTHYQLTYTPEVFGLDSDYGIRYMEHIFGLPALALNSEGFL